MTQPPLRLPKLDPDTIETVKAGYLGLFAGDDGKWYAKEGSNAAAEIGMDTEALQQLAEDAYRIPTELSSATYNADGTVNVITRDDGWVLTHNYTNGLLSSIVQTKSGQPTTTITLTYNSSEQLTSTNVVTA